MLKPTFISFLAILITLLQFFHPVISYPMDPINNQISSSPQEPTQPFTESVEMKQLCEICNDRSTDICYFYCNPSTDYPKGHTYCESCVAKISARFQSCPLCRASFNRTKFNQYLTKNPLSVSTWTFILESLNYYNIDLTKPITHLDFNQYTTNQIKLLFSHLTTLLYFGASNYSKDIEPILSNAIISIKMIQTKVKQVQKFRLHFDSSFKHSILSEYFKQGHYKVVNEIIQSNLEFRKIPSLVELIMVSFQYKNTTFLYDYMKQITSKRDKMELILNVIDQATDGCFLDGLLESIHSNFGYDTILMEELTIQVFNKSQIKYRNTGDVKCSLASSKDCRNYLRNYITPLSNLGKWDDIIEIYNKNQELFPIN